jgi:hypothetical protein
MQSTKTIASFVLGERRWLVVVWSGGVVVVVQGGGGSSLFFVYNL